MPEESSRKSRILIVDDDKSVLLAYQRNLHRHFDVETATEGREAMCLLGSEVSYAVVAVDMHMPGMNGLDLLQRARELCPDTTRIMLTGDADQRIAADAVNHGRVFRFLSKPCSPGDLVEAIEAGARQYQLVRAERDLLEQTLSGAVEVMTDLLATVDPAAFGSAQLLRYRAVRVARILRAEREWEIGLAALLSPIGRLAVSSRLLQRERSGEALSAEERDQLAQVPELGARMIRRIPRLEGVADAVLLQDRGFDGSGWPGNGPSGVQIPFGARVLKPLLDSLRDEQEKDLAYALDRLFGHRDRYDPGIFLVVKDFLEAEIGLAAAHRAAGQATPLDHLREGQVLAAPVATEAGRLVLLPGIRLTAGHIQLLRNLAELLDLRGPILIRPERP